MPDTLKIKLTYSAQLAHEAGTNGETLDVPSEMPLLQLLADQAARQSPRFRELLFRDGEELRKSIVVAVNGAQISDAASCALTEDSDVLVMTPIAGG